MTFEYIITIALLVTFIAFIFKRVLKNKLENSESEPIWVRYFANQFYLILFVFVFRTFLFESFIVPSPSMSPGIIVSDFLLVSKYSYSWKIPIINSELIRFSDPKVGDVVVFSNPLQMGQNVVKRVVGLPGDRIKYKQKVLSINGIPQKTEPNGKYQVKETGYESDAFYEYINNFKYVILHDKDLQVQHFKPENFAFKESCIYDEDSVECVIPPDNFYVIGDNRDNSFDSRFFGFIPRSNLIGRALVIWANPNDMSRVGKSPWIPFL